MADTTHPTTSASIAGTTFEPVSLRYGDVDIREIPPNGQGVTTLLMVAMLEALDSSGEDPEGARYHHLFGEATRLAFDVFDRVMMSSDGRAVAAFGVTGGPFQPIGRSRIVSALVDRGLDIQAAIDEPRSFHLDWNAIP